ncbi:MAG: hydroxymethylbilane synthase [Candidatus Omnitrophica bacterium]|nr:hydroxymethylbilane synthase [Candidatus Omnitrophota bacterium]
MKNVFGQGRVFRLGTRGSRLALAQSGEILRRLRARHPRLRFRRVIVKTFGDEFSRAALFQKNQVGVFTKAIEEKLLANEIDLAVHSLKDLPTELPRRLVIAACPRRLDPCDALVTRTGLTLDTLPAGALVGTSSPRRKRQIALLRPDVRVRDIRGNLDTRVRKVLREKTLDGVVVAKAGLWRIKKYLKYARRIPPDDFLPAVGQAALAVEVRRDDEAAWGLVRPLNHRDTERKVLAERALLRTLRGGCRVPVGVYSRIRDGRLDLRAAVFSNDTKGAVRGAVSGPSADPETLGRRLAQRLLKKGAGRFLR